MGKKEDLTPKKQFLQPHLSSKNLLQERLQRKTETMNLQKAAASDVAPETAVASQVSKPPPPISIPAKEFDPPKKENSTPKHKFLETHQSSKNLLQERLARKTMNLQKRDSAPETDVPVIPPPEQTSAPSDKMSRG